MKSAASAAFVAALGAAAAAHAGEGVALATLENGASIGFALVRSGTETASGGIGESALPRSNSVSRILWDQGSGAYFGYRVEVERKDGSRPFRVTFKPLDQDAVERDLKKRGGCAGCPAPVPLGAARPRFPRPQQLAESEALTLELLANPTTGDRIYDIVKLSERPISGEAMRAAASRVLEAQQTVRRADYFVARKDYASAANEYEKALQVLANDASTHNRLGICYQSLQKDALARREYDKALEINPGYAEVWNNIGTLEHGRRRFKAAAGAYRKAIEIKASLPNAWKNLGSAYFALGEVQGGFEAYQEAFRLDPTILEGGGVGVPGGLDAATQYFYFAKLLAQNAQKDASLEYLRRAKEAGFRDWRRVESDRDFRPVTKDPRYKELTRG